MAIVIAPAREGPTAYRIKLTFTPRGGKGAQLHTLLQPSGWMAFFDHEQGGKLEGLLANDDGILRASGNVDIDDDGVERWTVRLGHGLPKDIRVTLVGGRDGDRLKGTVLIADPAGQHTADFEGQIISQLADVLSTPRPDYSTGERAREGNCGAYIRSWIVSVISLRNIMIQFDLFERCLFKKYFMTFTAPPIPFGSEEIHPDATSPGAHPVQCFDSIIEPDRIVGETTQGERVRRSGELKVFVMARGCAHPEAYQYRKLTFQIIDAQGNVKSSGTGFPWQPDTAGGTRAPYQDIGGGTWFDMPSVPGGPFSPSQIPGLPPLSPGDIVRLKYEFETFFYCDGVLLGWFYWGYTIDCVFQGGALVPGSATRLPPAPVWGAPPAVPVSGGH